MPAIGGLPWMRCECVAEAWTAGVEPALRVLDREGEGWVVDGRCGQRARGVAVDRVQRYGQRLVGDPRRVRGDRRAQLLVGAIAHADTVGVVEVLVLARRLDAVHDLARPAFGDELGRELRVECDEQLAIAGGGQAGLLLEAHLQLVTRQLDALAVDVAGAGALPPR